MSKKSVYVRPLLEKEDSLKLRKQGKLPSMGSTKLVFVRDDKYSWLPAKVTSTGHLSATVRISLPPDWYDKTILPQKGINDEERQINLRDYVGQELPVQNFHDDEQGNTPGKSDMTDLYYLHDAAILYNLRDRHYRGNPYTRVGDIMIAVNPFRWIDCLYSEETQAFYANKLIWEKVSGNNTEDESDSSVSRVGKSTNLNNYVPLTYPPHVYETASLAYKGLLTDGQDQTILVTGESGAGKTETVKLVMSFLATVQRTHPDYESVSDIFSQYSVSSKGSDSDISVLAMVKRILKSNPIFEAFGNAKTIRNSNSSRFGKFTRLQFSLNEEIRDLEGSKVPNCLLIGSEYQTYLLEKSRAIKTHDSERLYHIFYQLIAAPDKEKSIIWEGLKNSSTSSFRYFGSSTIEIIDGVSDRDNWLTTIKSLYAIGLKGNAFLNLMRALCIVLQFGNLLFVPDPSSPETSTLISNPDELHKLADLMGITEDKLTIALTQRSVKASFEHIDFSLSPSDAKDGCDALAKEIYSLIFDYLVESIDVATNKSDETADNSSGTKGVISLLDIFGFECFLVNRFEQLCINYANERLQQKYVSDVFQEIQLEYEEEGIEVFDFSAIDNMKILDLIEGKLGIISILNEECVLPRGNDTSFVFKMKNANKVAEPLIQNNLFTPYEFGIAHFSGKVKYDARKFVERNKDSLPSDLVNAALITTNTLISSEFSKREERIAQSQLASKARSRKGKVTTVVSKFKAQLNGLIKNIESTRTRYIRCIKPNAEELPRVTDNLMTMNQLTSAGVTTAITIWRETYPKHLLFEQVLERFQCLAVINMVGALDSKSKASMLLAVLFEGKYKVVGNQIITPYACGKTKVFFRTGSLELLESSRKRLFSQSSKMVQKIVRGAIARNRFARVRNGIIKFQSHSRAKFVREDYMTIRNYIIVIQSSVRFFNAQIRAKKLRYDKAAKIVQKRWRGRIYRKKFIAMRRASLLIRRAFLQWRNTQKMKRALTLLVSEARQERINTEVKNERERMEGNYHDQISILREEITALRRDLEDEKNKNSVLRTQGENNKSSSAANKQTIVSLNDKAHQLGIKYDDQQKENIKLEKTLGILNKSHEKQIKAVEDKLLEVKSEKDEIIHDLQKEGASNEVEISHLNKRISELSEESHRQMEGNSSLRKTIEDLQQSHDDQVQNLKKELSNVENEKDDLCNKYKKENVENMNEISSLKENISEVSKECLNQRQSNTKLEITIQHMKEQHRKEMGDYKEMVVSIQNDMEKTMDEMENEAKSYEVEISQLNKRIFEISKDFNLQKEENTTLRSKIGDLHQAQQKEVDEHEKSLAKIKHEMDSKIDGLEKEGAANEVEISDLNLRISDLLKRSKNHSEEVAELEGKIHETRQINEKRVNIIEQKVIKLNSQHDNAIAKLKNENTTTEREISFANEKLSEATRDRNLEKKENMKLKRQIDHMLKARNTQISEYKSQLKSTECEKDKKINELGNANIAYTNEISKLKERISKLSEEHNLHKGGTFALQDSIDDLHQSHKDQINKMKDDLVCIEEDKNQEIANLKRKQADLQKVHGMELKSMKIDMLNYNAMHKTDLASYKIEIRRLVTEHEVELDRIYQLLNATQRADLIIQSIDEHAKSANEEKVQSLRQIMEKTGNIRSNATNLMKKPNKKLSR